MSKVKEEVLEDVLDKFWKQLCEQVQSIKDVPRGNHIVIYGETADFRHYIDAYELRIYEDRIAYESYFGIKKDIITKEECGCYFPAKFPMEDEDQEYDHIGQTLQFVFFSTFSFTKEIPIEEFWETVEEECHNPLDELYFKEDLI